MVRSILRVQRHARLPVWPAWQGLVLGVLSQLGPLRGVADRLEGAFGGRVCPISLDTADCDPFVLLVHHRHAFRPGDFLRPVFESIIMPEGFPAHPHRGFETVTYVLPERGGLVHRDSFGCKMRYGDGAVQWMTAGDGMLHEEMWDVNGDRRDFELYQLWVNLPPAKKRMAPRVQLLGEADSLAEVDRAGAMQVRRAALPRRELDGGAVSVRLLADDAGGLPEGEGADTQSAMTLAHVELRGEDACHELPLPEGWTCLVYVRAGRVALGNAADDVASTYEMAYMSRTGGDLRLRNAHAGPSDVLVLAGQPIGAPVAASGTMVMNSQAEVNEALRDYSQGYMGVPWEHGLADGEWASLCEAFVRRRYPPR